ncbi:Serine phosphatase RsbU, regulator of sigma subunit [Frankia canadensis]|uniref:Serine phosphatase RsbU, regulator of sigma subunit n=1 Tax=Frankia canadensis TaxID=1836972 RepID=A0A2I2KX88_9ACTN|nr:SpoIIE family protein phosphatase [Frankia canadensis]SNQ50278.1 Serine phosphatase RsbU, regulator of sigma subunit [Frankia canadensis]SOU57568.1 Serine phosphatase RsbU, regulator of sigma subunit [Frankia canadensis]
MTGAGGGPGIRAHAITLPPTPDSPRSARRFVLEALRGRLDDDLLDSALLLVTELVTNVVVHAGTHATVDVRREGHGVRVGVADRHPVRIGMARVKVDVPRPASAFTEEADFGTDGLREDGRGLALVDALATSWGTEHHRGGKTVWFRLGSPEITGEGADLAWDETGSDDSAVSGDRAARGDGDRVAQGHEVARVPVQARPPRLIARDSARALTAEGEVGELLAQLVDALAVTAALVRRPGRDGGRIESVATLGVVGEDADAMAFPLDPTQESLGELLLWPVPGVGLAPPDVERVRLATRWMALALGGGDMRRAEERRIGMLSFLAEASDLLAGSLELGHSLALLARLPVPRLAQWCAVYLHRENADPALWSATHAEENMAGALEVAAADPSGALMAAVRGASGDRVRSLTALGGPALVMVLKARRRLLGVLALGRPDGNAFAADEIDLLADLARRASFAIDNARLYSRQVELAGTLQAGLRPPDLPRIEGLDLGSAYGAAQSAGLDVGGDFFDLLWGPLGWTIAIGDVCGKGAEAATVTGVARAVLRLLTGRGTDLGEVLLELNRTLREAAASHPHGQGRFCTLAAASVTGPGESGIGLRLFLAGHPQPVVLHADGRASLVGRPGTLLGVLDDDEVSFPGVEITLRPGESLVLYTDGVIEARDGRDLLGEDRLLAAVGDCAGLTAQGIADRVLTAAERFAGGNLRDDVAILVARVPD